MDELPLLEQFLGAVELQPQPGFLALFLVSFLAATILPLGSELLLVGMLATGYAPMGCLIAAACGNSLGGATTYFVGRLGNPDWLRRWGVSTATLQHHRPRIDRWGSPLAFVSFVPVLGDPLLLAVGFFRVAWLPVMLWMTSGKLLRYALLVYGWGWAMM